jgi:peptidase E
MGQQIIAIGGGGFSAGPENLALERYILAQIGKPRPAVCFVPTASGDSDEYIRHFYEALCTLDCHPRHLSLFHAPVADLRDFILAQDAVYVGGGNTKNMLAIWRDWGLDEILREALNQGIVLAGVSAGAICWFEEGVTDSMMPPGSGRLSALACLGFLPGSNCPHYDGEPYRRPEYHRLLATGQICGGYAADDDVALHFVDGTLSSVVSSRSGAAAWRANLVGSEVVEARIQPDLAADEPC